MARPLTPLHRCVRRALALLAAPALVLTLWAAAGTAPAHAKPTDDNAAVAVNTEDGSTVLDFAFSIRRVAGDVVDNQNVAVALASCEGCQTVAIALQVVLVEGAPSTVAPVNTAVSLNESCVACTTVALAYQYVLGVGEPLRFTAEGRRRIQAIRKEFKALERSGLPLEEILARVDELRAELVDVLNTQLEVRGRGEGEGGDEESGAGEDADEGDDLTGSSPVDRAPGESGADDGGSNDAAPQPEGDESRAHGSGEGEGPAEGDDPGADAPSSGGASEPAPAAP